MRIRNIVRALTLLALLVTPALGGCGAEGDGEEDWQEAEVGEAEDAACSCYYPNKCDSCGDCIANASCVMCDGEAYCASAPSNMVGQCYADLAVLKASYIDACINPTSGCSPCSRDNACEIAYRDKLIACAGYLPGLRRSCYNAAARQYSQCLEEQN